LLFSGYDDDRIMIEMVQKRTWLDLLDAARYDHIESLAHICQSLDGQHTRVLWPTVLPGSSSNAWYYITFGSQDHAHPDMDADHSAQT